MSVSRHLSSAPPARRLLMVLISLGVPFALVATPNAGGTSTTTDSFIFTAAGDHWRPGTSSVQFLQAKASIDTVAASGSQFYLALGDLSYLAGGEQSWCYEFKSKFNDVEILAGNHDTGESSGGDINKYVQYCPFTLGSFTGDYGKQYYFDYPQGAGTPLARFIMIAPGVKGSLGINGINYNVGGAGYTFTREAIDEAQARGTKWIIAGMHKNCISMGTKGCEVGTDIMNLLIDEKVDLILQSHDHNYQRSHQLRCIRTGSVDQNCIADDGSDGAYVKGKGPVIIINGEFGKALYAINTADTEAGYFAKADSTTFGVSKYTVSDTGISAQYLRSSGGSFADSFTIREDAPATAIPTTPSSTEVPSATPTSTSVAGSTSTPTSVPSATATDRPIPTNVPTATPASVTGNLLRNPGFELDTNGDSRPDNWTSNSKLTRSSTTKHSGSYAGRHYATRNSSYTISQTIPSLSGGQPYSLDGWVYIPATSDTFTFKIQVQWLNSSSSALRTDTIKTYSNTSPKNTWHQAAKSLSPPTGTTSAQVRMVANSLKATIYVDDFLFQGGGSSPTVSTTAAPTQTSTVTQTPLPGKQVSIPSQTPTSAAAFPASTSFTFSPVADTYVSQASPGSAYGSATSFSVVDSPSAKQAFIRFDVTGLPAGASVSSAKLRLFVTNNSTSGGIFHRITNTIWPENITWASAEPSLTKPPIDGAQLASLGSVKLNQVVEVALPAGTITGNGSYSFAITLPSANTNTLGYASREATTAANRPQLMVTTQ